MTPRAAALPQSSTLYAGRRAGVGYSAVGIGVRSGATPAWRKASAARSCQVVAPAFKVVGDTVAVGDVIGLIEVMKSFNEVTADQAGTLVAFIAEDEEPVMAGQPLIELA